VLLKEDKDGIPHLSCLLSGTANLLLTPNLDAANIDLLKAAADRLPVGPILLGLSKPIHVRVPSVTARAL
jgi:malate dehydrogenase (oxaloacetate-decarboxylating)(NADP+)